MIFADLVRERNRKPFAATPLGIVSNTLFGLTSGTAALDVAGDVGRSIARSIGSVGVTLAKPLGGSEELDTDEIENKAFRGIFKYVFGEEPIEPLEDRIAKTELQIRGSNFAKKHGFDRYALPLAFGGILGDAILNLTPFGGSAKTEAKLLSNLVKETRPDKIFSSLVKLGVPEDVATTFAPKFAQMTEQGEVKEGVSVLKQALGMKYITERGAPKLGQTTEARILDTGLRPEVAQSEEAARKLSQESLSLRITKEGQKPLTESISSVPKELQPLAQEARKYKSAEEFGFSLKPKQGGTSLFHGTDNIEGILQKGKIIPYLERDLRDVNVRPTVKGVIEGTPETAGKTFPRPKRISLSQNPQQSGKFGDFIFEFDRKKTPSMKDVQEVRTSVVKKGTTGKDELEWRTPNTLPISETKTVYFYDSGNLAADLSVAKRLENAGAKDVRIITLGGKEQPSHVIYTTKTGQLTDFYNQVKRGVTAEAKDLINLQRLSLSDEGAETLRNTINEIKPALEEVKGGTLTNAEVLEAAKESDILRRVTSREATKKSEAALLKTRQNLTALAEGKEVTKDFVDQLRVVSAEATRRGRELQALGIVADPIQNTTKGQLVKKLIELGIETDKIVEAAKGVDFTNAKDVAKFYRKFIPPKFGEMLNEYRYINLLSSPRTHIVNAFSNLIQGSLLNPATRLATGAVDLVLSGLKGSQRQTYMTEVPAYYKGFLNAVGDGSKAFLRAMRGQTIIERPDLHRIPTNAKLLAPFQIIPRMLEGGDVFFRTMIEAGERQALALQARKQGRELTAKVLGEIEKEAKAKAEYFVFRKALDPSNETGQGTVLSAIDKATTAVYQLRKVPGVAWFVPFVQTPMNILKQGIEYSPIGFLTLLNASKKTEQFSKALIGSVVMAGAGSLALQGKTTWSAPTGDKEKEAFYNSGRQPYSVKVGDTWIGYSKLGPLAYPIAMASAMQWYLSENPKAVSESSIERATNVFNGIAGFFADQSYMQGLQSLLEFASGETRASGIKSVFGSTVGQVVPLSSLQRWVTHIIDPVYRKPESDLNLETLLQTLAKDNPFFSTTVPEIEGSTGRKLPGVNAFSPVGVTPANPRYERRLQRIRRQQELRAKKESRQNRKRSSFSELIRQ